MATATKKKPVSKKPATKKSPAKRAPARASGISINSSPDQPTLLIAIWLILILVFLVLVVTKR